MLASLVLIPLLGSSCAGAPAGRALGNPVRGAWNGTTLAATSSGLIRGRPDKEETFSWKGIPYAAAPVGDLRWKAPRQAADWKGVREAASFGPASVQRLPFFGLAKGDEDSLKLNIWRPADAATGLPVFFWIHGGGNSTGSADSPDYRGHALAARGRVVFISANYRLGPLGWFAHPGLAIGNAEDDSGNYGTLDLIAALLWVRDNIASFGGDPGNVTIAGESAGGFNVLTLLLAPKARGLFHRAIVQSGYRTTASIESARAFAESMASAAGLSDDPKGLRALPAKEIIRLAKSGMAGMLDFPYPVWDGAVLPAEGFAAFSDPAKVADVPIIIGTNREETKIFQWLGGEDWRDPFYQVRAEFGGARWKAQGADSIADAILKGDPSRKVYVYRFDWGAPRPGGWSVLGGKAGAKMGAAHGMEISFFLQTDTIYGDLLPLPLKTQRNEEGRKGLGALMGSYLSALAWHGDPNAQGLSASGARTLDRARPSWEPWSLAADPPFMVFDAGYESAEPRLEWGRMTEEGLKAKAERLEESVRVRLKKIMGW
ncbi:MAG TPA: carboxylesterase family protein [Rectinemataceae bacterium]